MSSVMMPVNASLRGAADTIASVRKLKRRGFTEEVPRCHRFARVLRNPWNLWNLVSRLFAWHHEMSGRRARVHDPHVAVGAAAVVRQPQRRRRRARHGDRHVAARAILVRSLPVIEDGPELRLDALAALLQIAKLRFRFRSIAARIGF